ncbi:F-box protein At2g32560 [Linum grandiflorum]
MLLYYLITCFSFILFLKSLLQLKPLPPWAAEMRLLSVFFWKDLLLASSTFPISFRVMYSSSSNNTSHNSSSNVITNTAAGEEEKEEENEEMLSVLDLPELALDCILERLSPAGLCNMAAVCSSLKERCTSDYLWRRHMNQKWGRLIGDAAHREWKWYQASRKDFGRCTKPGKPKGLFSSIVSSFPWIKLNNHNLIDQQSDNQRRSSSVHVVGDSAMSWYLALESGKFWFPAQVYNRENGHVGFMLSCYDADLSYDSRTDTFQARYPPHGRRPVAIETGVNWERLRAPPVNTSPHDLHVSDCLNQLSPGDHIEIQWRRNKEFPYGWWYGVVAHLESCDGDHHYCRCLNSENVVLEFHQYAPGSRWRRTIVNRKDHREEGNEGDGFYGGIRKLTGNDEISMWKRLWPMDVLE